MTYIVEKPAVSTSVSVSERLLITIEFAPDISPTETEYTYEHPKFVFGDRVIITDHFPELEFTVCALELIESKTSSGKLLNQPYWKYKVSDGKTSFWKDETALVRNVEKTGASCTQFTDVIELDRDGYLIGNETVENAYDDPNFITNPDEPF